MRGDLGCREGSAMGVDVVPGTVIGRKYRVDRILGQGGMAVVLAATDTQLERPVALKLMLPELLTDEVAVARFVREARAAVRLRTEHVAHVYEVGTTDEGAPFMAMEYLEGSDLDALLQKSGVLRIEDACDYVLQACEAISEAHAAGIVHRDLKPHNLFLTHRPNGSPLVKVLDFGISKVDRTADGKKQLDLTRTRSTLGSPLYMAPEQMRSTRAVDGRADIWALGVILYELLTGQVPFMSTTMQELTLMIAQDPAVTPRAHRPDLPEGLAEVVLRCLQKEPEGRFPSIAALVSALVPFSARSSAPVVSSSLPFTEVPRGPGTSSKDLRGFLDTVDSSPVIAIPPHVGIVAQAKTNGSWGKNGEPVHAAPSKTTSWRLVSAAGALCVVLSLGAFLVTRHRESAAPASAATEPEVATVAPSAPATDTAMPSSADSASRPVDAPPTASASGAPGPSALARPVVPKPVAKPLTKPVWAPAPARSIPHVDPLNKTW
jgi:serine/threonine protein kinase